MKRNQVFPSTYLSKDDVNTIPRGTLLTIADVRLETIRGDGGEDEKPVLHFQGSTKPMILNNTNWMALEEAYGDDSDWWRGKEVEAYVDPGVMFGGKRVGGVRLRAPSNGHVQPTVWTLDEACAKAAEHGISKEDIVAVLKAEGKSGWSGPRDTPTVQKMIQEKEAQAQREADEEQIPF